MRFRVSRRIVPGVRVTMSKRGVRTSVGPRAARLHVGGGRTTISSGFGPFTATSGVGGRRSRRSSARTPTRSRTSGRRQTSPTRSTGTINSRFQRWAAWETERRLTTVHLRAVHPAAPPPAVLMPRPPSAAVVRETAVRLRRRLGQGVPVFDRERRRAITAEASSRAPGLAHRQYVADLILAQREQARQQERWDALCRHVPGVVVAEIADALRGAGLGAVRVAAGRVAAGRDADGCRRVRCVVTIGTVAIVPGQVYVKSPGRAPAAVPRPEADRNAVYLKAVSSLVLGTVRAVLAASPATDEVQVLVLRHDQTATLVEDALRPIYSGRFPRTWVDVFAWTQLNVIEAVRSAPAAVLHLRGSTLQVAEIMLGHDPRLQELVAAVRRAHAHLPDPNAVVR